MIEFSAMLGNGLITHGFLTVNLMTCLAALCGYFVAPRAHAEVQRMPDQYQQFVTDDGWTVGLTLTDETIDHLDNIAGAANSWQAHVSYRGEATISGAGNSSVQDAQLETGYFVGCRTDSSSGLELGADAGLFVSERLSGHHHDLDSDASPFLSGSLRAQLKPGGLAQLVMDRVHLHNMRAVSRVRTMNIEADGCGGQVKIQSYATFRIRTENGNDSQTLYGEPKQL